MASVQNLKRKRIDVNKRTKKVCEEIMVQSEGMSPAEYAEWLGELREELDMLKDAAEQTAKECK